MPGVTRLNWGQLATALVRPRRMRGPCGTPTQGLRAVPGGARKKPWVVLGNLPLARRARNPVDARAVLDITSHYEVF